MLGWTQSTTNPAEFVAQTELCTLTVLLKSLPMHVDWEVKLAGVEKVLSTGSRDTTNLAMIAAEQAAQEWEATTVSPKPQGDV